MQAAKEIDPVVKVRVNNRSSRRKSQSPKWDDLELLRVVSLKEAAHMRGVSIDTLKRHDRDKFVELSPGRVGMRVGDALQLEPQA